LSIANNSDNLLRLPLQGVATIGSGSFKEYLLDIQHMQ